MFAVVEMKINMRPSTGLPGSTGRLKKKQQPAARRQWPIGGAHKRRRSLGLVYDGPTAAYRVSATSQCSSGKSDVETSRSSGRASEGATGRAASQRRERPARRRSQSSQTTWAGQDATSQCHLLICAGWRMKDGTGWRERAKWRGRGPGE